MVGVSRWSRAAKEQLPDDDVVQEITDLSKSMASSKHFALRGKC